MLKSRILYFSKVKEIFPSCWLHKWLKTANPFNVFGSRSISTIFILGTIHILRNHQRGEGGRPNAYFWLRGGRGGIGSWLRNHVILWKSCFKKISCKNFRAPRIFPFLEFWLPYGWNYAPQFAFLNQLFESKNDFSRWFFENIMMASIQERFVIKSKLWWRVYGILHLYR